MTPELQDLQPALEPAGPTEKSHGLVLGAVVDDDQLAKGKRAGATQESAETARSSSAGSRRSSLYAGATTESSRRAPTAACLVDDRTSGRVDVPAESRELRKVGRRIIRSFDRSHAVIAKATKQPAPSVR